MIDDNTPSGVPLPHPGNPAIADATRIRNALTVIDARQVAAGDAHADLADALADEEAARIAGDTAEAAARAAAIAAEATARGNADTALSNAIAAIPTFNPALYYDKPATDALIAGRASASDVSLLTLLALDVGGAGDAIDRWDHALHDAILAIDTTLSVDHGGGPFPAPIISITNHGSGWTSNTSYPGLTPSMSPAPTVAGDEYKALDNANNGVIGNAAVTTATYEVAFATPVRVDNWVAYPTLSAARTGSLYFEGYRSGVWTTLDTVAFTASAAPTSGWRNIPSSMDTYDKIRLRIAITSGGAATVTWDNFRAQRNPTPVYISQAETLAASPATFTVMFSASLTGITPTTAIVALDLSRDNGTTWINVPLTRIGTGASTLSATATIGYFSGGVTMSGPAGTQLRWRMRPLSTSGATLTPVAILLKWTD